MAPVDHLKPLQWLDVTEDGVDRIKNWKSKLYKNLLYLGMETQKGARWVLREMEGLLKLSNVFPVCSSNIVYIPAPYLLHPVPQGLSEHRVHHQVEETNMQTITLFWLMHHNGGGLRKGKYLIFQESPGKTLKNASHKMLQSALSTSDQWAGHLGLGDHIEVVRDLWAESRETVCPALEKH